MYGCGCCCGLRTCPTCGGAGVVPAPIYPIYPRPINPYPYPAVPWRPIYPYPRRPYLVTPLVPGMRFSGNATADVAAARA